MHSRYRDLQTRSNPTLLLGFAQPIKRAREDLLTIGFNDCPMSEDETVEVQRHDFADRLPEGVAVFDKKPKQTRAADAAIDAVEFQKQLSYLVLLGDVEVEHYVSNDQCSRCGMQKHELVD